MRRKAQLLLIALYSSLLLLVGIQSFWPFFRMGRKLNGTEQSAPPPVWNWASLRSGEAFREADIWYNANVGLRNFWVRLDNQISYTFFGETTTHEGGTPLIVGAHDWIFERAYLNSIISPKPLPRDRVKKAVSHIRSVQDKLASRGIPLLLLIAPNKVSAYPEHVPSAYFAGHSPDQAISDFEHFQQELLISNINFYDGPHQFDLWKKNGQKNLFARSGTHWSYFAAWHVLLDLRERLNPHMQRPMPALPLPKFTKQPARDSDKDLLNLLNLLYDSPYNHPQLLPEIAPQNSVSSEKLPRILWVHDSFGWQLIELLYLANAAQPTESLYYFSKLYRIPGGTPGSAEVKDIDWPSFIKKYDAVVVVCTETNIPELAWRFFETVDTQLPPLPGR